MSTEFENGQVNDIYQKFANSLKDFKIEEFNEENAFDPINTIREFRSIAGVAALHMRDTETESCADWELEAKLWHLLELLLSYRTADQELDLMDIYPYNSSAVLEKKLLQENRELYQIWIIIVWIQNNIGAPERPTNLPTSKWSNTIISGGLKSCDLDFPLRDAQAELSVKDKEQDHTFFKYVYESLVSGNFEEAFEECRLSDNLTVGMILCGMQEYLDPTIDIQLRDEFETQQGVKKHALWRRAVYSLSRNTEIDIYERAIYCFLAGDVPPEEVLDESSWESALMLYLNQILQIEVENYLKENKKVPNDELLIALPTEPMSLPNVLNLISSRFAKESEHPIRVLMGAVILDTLPAVLRSSVEMLLDILKGDSIENDLTEKPYLLRIVTHISIILDIITPGIVSATDKSKLITAYVSIMKLRGLYDVIPIYISFLDEKDVEDAYSFVLSTLEEPEIRKKQLEIANFLRLPTANILRRTTQRIFTETESEYTPSGDIVVSFDIAAVDKHLIFGVEWLLQGKLYIDAMDSVIALARRFLINGKIKALEYFMDRNSLGDLQKNYELEKISQRNSVEGPDSNLKELLEYQSLITEVKKYEEWQKTISLLNSESNIPSLIEKFQHFSEGTYELVKSFLVELSENEGNPDREIFFEIRSLYTPYLIIELHKGLVDAAMLLKIPTFIEEAMKFTNLVANETDKIYLLFQSSGKLRDYLQLIAHTATLGGKNIM